MRILLVSNLYPPAVCGGAEILAADVAAQLEKLGHEVLVLTGAGQSGGTPDGRIWRTLRLAPTAHFDGRRSPLRQLPLLFHYYRGYHCRANARELRRVVEATRPDLLYVWEITGTGVVSLLRALSDLKLPVVFHLGSYWLLYARTPQTEQSRLRTSWLKRCLIGSVPLPQWTSSIAVSATVKRRYAEAGCAPERIEVIYNGVDSRFLTLPPAPSPFGSTAQGVQLLFVGRLRVEKGLLVLFRALDQLASTPSRPGAAPPALHLNIFGVGDQVYVDELQAFLRERQLTSLVTFHGKVPQDRLIEYYDHSHVLLVPSLWEEPFGLVVAEAMARGLPVIASRVGGPAEILTHGVDGLLVEPGDERALAAAIGHLLAHPDQRERLGQAARATVRDRFTIEQNARSIERHLQQALQSGRPAALESATSTSRGTST